MKLKIFGRQWTRNEDRSVCPDRSPSTDILGQMARFRQAIG